MPKTLQQEKMPIVQHLIELRGALLRSVIAIVIFFAILFPFADDIYTFIAAPIVRAIQVPVLLLLALSLPS